MERLLLVIVSVCILTVGVSPVAASATRSDLLAGRGAAAAATPTRARLSLMNGAVHAHQRVQFTFAGSSIAAGRKLRTATLRFGDNHLVVVRSLAARPVHTYARAGTYTATWRLTDSHGNTSLTRRKVLISPRNTIRFRPATSRVPARAVTSARSLNKMVQVVVLARGYKAPKIGGALVAGPGGKIPQGIALKVRFSRRTPQGTTIVRGTRAGLSDIYSTLRVATPVAVGKRLILADRRLAGRADGQRSLSSSAVPFTCNVNSGNDRPLSVTADFSSTKVEPYLDLGARTLQFIVISRPTLTLSAAFGGTAQCSLGNYFALNIPVPSLPGLVVSISPYFSLSANGTISADFTWSPTFIMNITRSPSYNESSVSLFAKASASANGSATLTLEGGVQLAISFGGSAGLRAKLGPKINVTASITSANGGQACINVTSSITASISLFADILFLRTNVTLYSGEYYKSTLFTRCTPAGATPGGGGGAAGSGAGTGGGYPGGGRSDAPTGPPTVTSANNNGQMAVRLTNWPLGTTYFFCHFGDAGSYPRGGTVPNRGQFTLTSYSASFLRGLCSGEGNAWIGLQAPNGNDYYSNQAGLHYVPPTVAASNNNGQMAVSLSGFPLGTTYFYCHSGDGSVYPRGGDITGRGQFTVAAATTTFTSGVCAGEGNSWIGLQASDGSDYYSNQANLHFTPPSVLADNNNGQMTVHLSSFPLGVSYFFCHSGSPDKFPAGGVITGRGQITVTNPNQYWASGFCRGRGNAWVGIQATDGHSYYSTQTNLVAAQTPGASVTATNNNGQMAVQLTGFPTGVTYFFCHSGNPSDFPTGGVVTNHGQITVTNPDQYWSTGLCAGRGNAWIGIQATDGADYYSNQVDLVAAQTAGASIDITAKGSQIYLNVHNFPGGRTYFFCHTGAPSQYPTGGSIANRGSVDVATANQTFGPVCGGAGNFWVGVQATDGADYYSNQVQV